MNLSELRVQERKARARLQQAESRLKSSNQYNARVQNEVANWQLKQDAQNPRQPKFVDTHPGRTPDIPMSSPISAESIGELEAQVSELRESHESIKAQLDEAVVRHQGSKPKRATGYEAGKPTKILGVSYAPGEPVDVSGLSPEKLRVLEEHRVIQPV